MSDSKTPAGGVVTGEHTPSYKLPWVRPSFERGELYAITENFTARATDGNLFS